MTASDSNITLGFTKESFPEGTHMCLFYSDEKERLDVVSRFLQAGMTAGEHVGYFAHAYPPEELVKNLQSSCINLDDEETSRQLFIGSTESICHPDGLFDPDKMLEKLQVFYSTSMEAGFSGARVCGEMDWALQDLPGTDRLIEFEARANIELLNKSPITSICQYNITLFDGKTIMDVLRVHPVVILRGQITRNPFYSLPDEFTEVGD